MSRLDLDRLLDDVQRDPELREDFRNTSADSTRLAQWAVARGYELTDSEIADLVSSERELSDDDLENAAGGEDAWGSGTPPAPGDGG
jgi:predicted ribosomally synthesized peptide with nif11-like leader